MVDGWNSTSVRGTMHLNGGLVATYYGRSGRSDSSGKIRRVRGDFHYDGQN
jgi:hypothetical protein